MTMAELKQIKEREPFEAFTIHMNDGSRLRVAQPDDIFLHRNIPFDAIVVLPKGRFSIIYLRNIAHVTTRGRWPKMGGRKRRNGSSHGDE